MAKVKVGDNESIDNALRRFKRECEKSGVMHELKRREFYESPSARKKRKAQEAARKRRKRERKKVYIK
ncbi:MAG: 30S ribosomal protein S21 [bacterium]